MSNTAKQDLKWLSDLSGSLVRQIEAEEQRAAKLFSRMRAMALKIATEAIAAEKKARKK